MHCLMLSTCTLLYFPQDELYLFVGKAIALSILSGGPGPSFFADAVVDYLFAGVSAVQAKIEDIPDESIQQQVSKVCCFYLLLQSIIH